MYISTCICTNLDTAIHVHAHVSTIYVTFHEKTKHIAQKMILELRVPWPLMLFELIYLWFKFEVPRPCSFRDISKSVRGSTILNITEKRNRSYYVQ